VNKTGRITLIAKIISITIPYDVMPKLATVSDTDVSYFSKNIKVLLTCAAAPIEVRCTRSLKSVTTVGNYTLISCFRVKTLKFYRKTYS
jgi:hypothetical protein